MKILIWGTLGGAAKYHGFFDDANICGYIDSTPDGDTFAGKPLYAPGNVKDVDYDFIFVGSIKCKDILVTCIEEHIALDRIVFCDCTLRDANIRWYEWLNDNMLKLCAAIRERRILRVKCATSDKMDKGHIFDEWSEDYYERDYFRYRTFEMLADVVISKGLEGNVAELGVFRGDFSRLINQKFPDRTLYLFDSFEGFEPEEAKKELNRGTTDEEFIDTFKDTSVEYVLNRMPHRDKTVVREGYFPGTAEGLDDLKFCFVSIDVDFEESIYQGVKWFYPRLVEGGYIMLHDYWCLGSIANAIRRVEKEFGISFHVAPIADNEGTLIITK